MRIRLAQPSDASTIAALHAASWRATYREAFSAAYLAEDVDAERERLWSQRLRQPEGNQRVLVAEARGGLRGFACAYLKSDAQWGSLLDNIHVVQALQGQGVGKQLLRAVAAECGPAGGGLFLWVLQTNTSARRFYEHLGGQRAAEDLWSPPGGGLVPRYRYVWRAVRVLLAAG